MSTTINDNSMDLHQAEAISRLPADMMMLKMENESIMAVARATPRDPVKIVKQLQELIDAYPAAADDAIYSKPVGTVCEVTCGDCGVRYEVAKVDRDTQCPACESQKIGAQRKVKKFAEGLSVRAAESIRSIYGYTRLATTVEMLEDGRAKLTGVLVDYAAGNVTSDERIVSPMYKSRSGKMERTPEDRFLGVVVKAEKAKLRRDVILDNTPNIVKAMFRDACEKKLEGLLPLEVIDQKIVPAFAAYGITIDHLEQIVGRPRSLGWRESERLELKKILTALKNEETTVRELLDGLTGADGKEISGAKNGGSKVGKSDAKPTDDTPTPDADQSETGPDWAAIKRAFAKADTEDAVAAIYEECLSYSPTPDQGKQIEQWRQEAQTRVSSGKGKKQKEID